MGRDRGVEVLARAVAAFRAIDLEALDERAALQRRTDRKYLVSTDQLGALLDQLAHDHEALELERTRTPAYESVYFDTPDLRCFTDHVADRTPRFKVRSRLYVATRTCSFEVKVKTDDDETAKHHLPQSPDDHGRLTGEQVRFARETIERWAHEPAPDDLSPALTTRFRRATLAATDGHERVTIDASLTLTRPDGTRARLDDALLLVEIKSPDGRGRADDVLARAGVDEISLSKYRTGIALLAASAEDAGEAAAHFRVETAA